MRYVSCSLLSASQIFNFGAASTMMRRWTTALVLGCWPLQAAGFLASPTTTFTRHKSTPFYLSSDDNDGPRSSSRIEGLQREPSPEELAIIDEMITKLTQAKPYELPNAVRRAFRVISSPRFFVRIAELSDAAKDPAEQERLSTLASNLIRTLEVVVETTEEQLDERAKDVEAVVKAAAEPDSGEFLVPLLPERIKAMRQALVDLDEGSLDEGFLSTLDAWMNKSHQDGMDLMVQILQKALQMYAGTQIGRALERQSETDDSDSAVHKLFLKLLETDAESWDTVLQQEKEVEMGDLLKLVQKTMESVVLNLEAGSVAQRVQAEYTQEMVKRIEAALNES